MNTPSASHMGGVWERHIRSVRAIICALLQNSGQQLDDKSLRTFMCGAETIVNSRPLTTDGLTTPSSLEPLRLNHLLAMKANVLLNCHHQGTSSIQTSTLARDVVEFNIWQTHSGTVGKRTSFSPCKNFRHGTVSVPTSRKTTLCCSRTTTFPAINGSSHALSKPNQTQMVWYPGVGGT